MSFALMTTTITDTATATSTHSSPLLRQYHNLTGKAVIRAPILCTRKQNLVFKLRELGKDHGGSIDRRNVLIGMGSLCAAAAASNIFDKNSIANAGGYGTVRSQPIEPVPEFGSEPRPLNDPIRALVDKPKKKEDTEEVLIVYGINIPNNELVRFDVYVDTPKYGNGGGGLIIMNDDTKDYGALAGSMVNLAHTRVGRKAPYGYGSLNLGISELIEDIKAEDSSKLVVTLVPRSGQVIIGGVRIEDWDYEE